MHNLYGKRKLKHYEIKGKFTLPNGMYCVWGNPPDEGISVDIYDDATKTLLIGMEHGIDVQTNNTNDVKRMTMLLKALIKSFIDELEDSMVYYYGPRECTFEEEDITKPVPAKTGRFA